MPSDLEAAAERRNAQEAVAREHAEYLQKHPEIQQIPNDFVSAALVEMPADVFQFARSHFAGPEADKK